MSNFLTRKFNHNDINHFLPDNKTVGTVNFYQNKFKGLPDEICELLEVSSREEYTEEDLIKCKEKIIQEKKDYMKKLDDEMAQRNEENNDEEIPILSLENIQLHKVAEELKNDPARGVASRGCIGMHPHDDVTDLKNKIKEFAGYFNQTSYN